MATRRCWLKAALILTRTTMLLPTSRTSIALTDHPRHWLQRVVGDLTAPGPAGLEAVIGVPADVVVVAAVDGVPVDQAVHPRAAAEIAKTDSRMCGGARLLAAPFDF